MPSVTCPAGCLAGRSRSRGFADEKKCKVPAEARRLPLFKQQLHGIDKAKASPLLESQRCCESSLKGLSQVSAYRSLDRDGTIKTGVAQLRGTKFEL